MDWLISLTRSRRANTLHISKNPWDRLSKEIITGHSKHSQMVLLLVCQLLEVRLVKKYCTQLEEKKKKDKILLKCIIKHTATLLQVSKETENITGVLIKLNIDSDMENKDY